MAFTEILVGIGRYSPGRYCTSSWFGLDCNRYSPRTRRLDKVTFEEEEEEGPLAITGKKILK